MKYRQNIHEIIDLKPDFMGFIFYQDSERYVGEVLCKDILKAIPETTQKVAVFVNENPENVIKIKQQYGFDYVQLHGDESPSYCSNIFSEGIKIIKAYRVNKEFDFTVLNQYTGYCDLFLFDTKSKMYGGTGKTFNWEILKKYTLEVPFLLSGGIGVENIKDALELQHPGLAGFDLNSKLEIKPALKSREKSERIIKTIKKYERN